MSEFALLFIVAAAITILLFFVVTLRMHAFIALFLVSMLTGLAAGMTVDDLLISMQAGMGETLGFVAVIVGLGAMFGQMMDVSGGAERLARTLMKTVGDRHLSWGLAAAGFLIGIPVFFDVGFILLMPIVYRLAKKSGRSLLFYALPLFAGLSASHSLVPPTPGPVGVAHLIGADLGLVIVFGLLAGIPAALVAGPLFGAWVSTRIDVKVPAYMQLEEWEARDEDLPPFRLLIGIIVVPLLFMCIHAASEAFLPPEHAVRLLFSFIGHPFAVMLLSVLLVFYFLGVKRGYSGQEVRLIAEKAIQPAGLIILVTGAGGVFKQVLVDSDVNAVLSGWLTDSALPPIILGYVLAAVVRLLQGSATVAMVTSSGLIASMLETHTYSETALALLAVSISAGGIFASHVNDSGFWLVNRYLGLTVQDTLKTWTVLEALTSLTAFAMVLIVSFFLF